MEKKYQNSLIITLVVIFVVAVFFLRSSYIETEKNHKLRVEMENRDAILQEKLETLDLTAKAISVFDVEQDKEIFEINSKELLPMASLAKTLGVIVALENLNDDKITINSEAIKEAGDNGLYANEVWNTNDLIKFSLLVSSNDGIYALTSSIPNFLDKLNAKARVMGLKRTIFKNPTGLDLNETEGGAYTTANEANFIALYALRARPEIFQITKEIKYDFYSVTGFKHEAYNTNIVIDKIPNVLFSKTGNTNLAGGNLTIVFISSTGKTYAVTVLGSTAVSRFEDMLKIVAVLNEPML